MEQDLTPEEAKASMGIATNLMSNLMPQGQEDPGTGENGGQNPKAGNAQAFDPEALKSEIITEVQSVIKQEMESFKQLIQEALTNDNEAE